jgi:hypothetical protein
MPGKLLTFYVTLVRDRERYKNRLKLCGECVTDLQHTFSNQWSDKFVLTKFNDQSACHSCGQLRGELGTLHPFYVTCWNRQQQRFDYSAAYCDECSTQVQSHFTLTRNGASA